MPGMPVQEEEPKRDAHSPWSKSWVFFLAFLCLLSLGGLGTWGRLRMLEDDNAKLEKRLETEMKIHEQQETQLRTSLRHKSKIFKHLRTELEVANHHFKKINASLKTVNAHEGSKPDKEPSQFLAECNGVTLPHGYEFAPKGQVIFPHDISQDTAGLHALLQANDSLGSLYQVTLQAENAKLFTQPTFPWSQYTWLQAVLEQPDLKGNFTEWGIGEGGSLMFLAGLARLRGASAAGFDTWNSANESQQHQKQFAESAEKVGVSIPQDAELFDLSAKSIAWPEAGRSEQLAFSHIDSNDYQTTLGILKVVYPSTVEGGIIVVDNFFHPSGGSKKAVQDFFKETTPGKLPMIYPVFPGLSMMIFKDRFANTSTTEDGTPNVLDGNYYSFKYIKGQPELFDAVNRSVSALADVHNSAMEDSKSNSMAICWLSLALHNAKGLRDFMMSTEEHVEDFETADIFRFMADSAQLMGGAHVA